jgi:hypothetical protein
LVRFWKTCNIRCWRIRRVGNRWRCGRGRGWVFAFPQDSSRHPYCQFFKSARFVLCLSVSVVGANVRRENKISFCADVRDEIHWYSDSMHTMLEGPQGKHKKNTHFCGKNWPEFVPVCTIVVHLLPYSLLNDSTILGVFVDVKRLWKSPL